MVRIGSHVLPGRVFLAPMAGITDRVFRDICIEQGAAYAASEMISSDTLLHATAKTRHRVERGHNELPHAVQIAGSEPEQLAAAAAFNVANGADIIDINMGCPARKVCNRLAGSALLEDPALVERILRAVVARVDVPVTLKIRTGPDAERRNGVDIARIAEDAGIACLAVHGRTRADRFRGEAEYRTIADIVTAVSMPVIANGDIASAADARAVLEQTGAAGVMIGRAARGNPWVFAGIAAAVDGKVPDAAIVEPSLDDIAATLIRHVRGCHALYGEYRGLRIARKHVAWYCSGFRNAAAFRQRINHVDDASVQLALIESFLAAPERFPEAA
ncbi:MAG: tRNA dihydrouridine synthase DusB [Gammaproteobacteria bacterium]|nr:MAG: tRNA dihydrouridine synthase DusB [Gammaproteobacteria bacterium]PIE36080.1 MAG: tRNA dihydrouridine synthase DusB [Gammaproteobacteria bacterium]